MGSGHHRSASTMRSAKKMISHHLELQNACAEIKLRAERRAGELLVGMDRQKSGAVLKLCCCW